MNLNELSLIKEGKSKRIYSDGEFVYLEFKGDVRCSKYSEQYDDDIATIRAKASYLIFKKLKEQFQAVSYAEFIHPNIIKMEVTKPLPLEVIPRFVAAGSVVKRFGFQEGYVFKKPVLKIDYKTDEDDYLITDELLLEMNIINPTQLNELKTLSLSIAVYLKDFFMKKGGNLWDFKMEFGVSPNGEIKLIDEISFDGMRLRSINTGESLDKDVYREAGDLKKTKEAYNKAYKLFFEGESI